MKLQDGPLVKWKDGEAWHTGCVMVDARNGMAICATHGAMMDWRNCDAALVKHGFTGELEFVPSFALEERPNEHPE